MTDALSKPLVSKLEVFLSYRTVEARLADALKKHLEADFIGLVRVFVATDQRHDPSVMFDALPAQAVSGPITHTG